VFNVKRMKHLGELQGLIRWRTPLNFSPYYSIMEIISYTTLKVIVVLKITIVLLFSSQVFMNFLRNDF
jgi:hypothetical protein